MAVYRIVLNVIAIVGLVQIVSVGIVQSQADDNSNTDANPIVVASLPDIENQIIGKIIVLQLQNAGFDVDDRTESPFADTRAALKDGEIDIYPELTGTALSAYHNLPTDTLPNDRERSYALAKRLDEREGIIWLKPMAYAVHKALIVRTNLWDQGIHSIDDLATHMNENDSSLRLCMAESYIDSGNVSLRALEEVYEFSFDSDNILLMGPDDTVVSLGEDACDVAWATNTTNEILFWEEHELEDTRNYFPDFVPAPIIRQEILDENPEIADALASFTDELTVKEMLELKAAVQSGFDGIAGSGDEESVEVTALSFLRRLGFLETPPITVASTHNPEALLLGKMVVLLLQNAGYNVNDQTNSSTPNLRPALESGEIDIYPETTGSALTSYHNLPVETLPLERDRSYALAKRLDERRGIAWLVPTAYTLHKTLVVNRDLWDQGIHTIDDLATYMNENDSPFRLCIIDTLLESDHDGLAALEETYRFRFRIENVLSMPQGETLENLGVGNCDVAVGTNIDGHIAQFDERALEDNRSFYPYYVPAPVIRQVVLDENPHIEEVLAHFVDGLTEAKMSELNALVDIGPDGIVNSGDEEDAESVARRFLRSIGELETPPLTVASTSSSENLILGKIIVQLLQEAGFNVNEETDYPAETIREALHNGEIDIYLELSGTALTAYHDLDTGSLPVDSERSYSLVKRMDEAEGILWLNPTDFVLSKTLVVRDEIWDQGIETIDELAAYMRENESPLRLCMIDTLSDNENTGLSSLEQVYGFSFKRENVVTMPQAETLEGLNAGQCDVAVGTNVDGHVLIDHDYLLEDTRGFYPPYVPAPIIKKETLDDNPNIAEVLASFGQYLTPEVMTELNARVSVGADGLTNSGDEESADAIATLFLRSAGFLDTPPIVVASKDDEEQRLLGQMLLELLQQAGFATENKIGISAREIRPAMERGEIDVYVEASGLVLSNYHDLPVEALPREPHRIYQLAKKMDEFRGIIWMDQSNYTNRFALIAEQELIDRGIRTIDELANFMNANDSPLRVCVADIFYEKQHDGLLDLQEAYGFAFTEENILSMPLNETFVGLHDGECDVAAGMITNGLIEAWKLTVLEDTRSFLQLDIAAPVVRKEVLDHNPRLADILTLFSQQLNEGTVMDLVTRINVGPDGIANSGDEESLETIAHDYLESVELLQAVTPDTSTDIINDSIDALENQ